MTARDQTPRTPRWQRIGLAALAALALVGILIRVPSIAEPLAVDQGLWASAARAMDHGFVLYRDVLDQKPPGIFLAYLWAFRVFGWHAGAIAWLDVLAAAVTTGFVFAILRRLSGVAAGLIGAATYSLLSAPVWLFRYGGISERSIAETFIMAGVAGSTWCATRLRDRWSIVSAFGLGVGIGWAIVFKPNAGLYLPALLAWVALVAKRPFDWRAFAVSAAAACAGAAFLPLAVLVWLWRAGVWPEAWVALVDFNRYYIGQRFELPRFLSEFFRTQVGFRVENDPLWAAAAIGVLLMAWRAARTRRLEPVVSLAVLWGGASALVIAANGARLYPTYFLLPVPALTLLVAWVLRGLAERDVPRRAAGVVGCALMLWLLARKNYVAKVGGFVAADLAQLTGGSDRAGFLRLFENPAPPRGYSALANEELAGYVAARTDAGDLIYQFGINFSGVYFATDRLPANKFLRVNFFVPSSFPAPDFQLDAVVRDLAAKRPKYLIFERLHSPRELADAVNALPSDPTVARLLAGYRLETAIEDFTLYRRVD